MNTNLPKEINTKQIWIGAITNEALHDLEYSYFILKVCVLCSLAMSKVRDSACIPQWTWKHQALRCIPNPASVKQRSPKLLMRWSLSVLSAVGTFQGLLIYSAHRFMAEISGKSDLIRLWLGSKAWDHALEQMTWINSCRRRKYLMG